MERLFVPFEIAKKLKEKGFNEDCFTLYKKNKKLDSLVKGHKYLTHNFKHLNECGKYWNKPDDSFTKEDYFKSFGKDFVENSVEHCVGITAPIYQQVKDWFVDKHNIHIIEQLDRTAEPKYCYEIWKYEDFGNWTLISKRPEFFLHYSPIENLNDAILEALELI